MTRAQREALAAVAEIGDVTTAEAVLRQIRGRPYGDDGRTVQGVGRALRNLWIKGLIERSDGRKYELTDRGREFLEASR